MKRLVLVTGGARSGKSTFAESLFRDLSPKVYLATAPVCDEEMARRVRLHRQRREGENWRTVEEEREIASVLETLPAGTSVLVDCLTLWINNLIYHAEQNGSVFSEERMAEETDRLLDALKDFDGTAVFVINEVGLGVVPETVSGRLFRDCSGRCAQRMAAAADEVYCLICGIPRRIK